MRASAIGKSVLALANTVKAVAAQNNVAAAMKVG
jgi:hypothetical protein